MSTQPGHPSVGWHKELVPAWAGKVTVGLVSHWPCVTDNSGLSTYGLNGLWKGDETPPTLLLALLYLYVLELLWRVWLMRLCMCARLRPVEAAAVCQVHPERFAAVLIVRAWSLRAWGPAAAARPSHTSRLHQVILGHTYPWGISRTMVDISVAYAVMRCPSVLHVRVFRQNE